MAQSRSTAWQDCRDRLIYIFKFPYLVLRELREVLFFIVLSLVVVTSVHYYSNLKLYCYYTLLHLEVKALILTFIMFSKYVLLPFAMTASICLASPAPHQKRYGLDGNGTSD